MAGKIVAKMFTHKKGKECGVAWAHTIIWYESIETVRKVALEQVQAKRREVHECAKKLNKALDWFGISPMQEYKDEDLQAELIEDITEMESMDA